MQLGFYFDQQRCTGCYTCVVACKEWHEIPPGPVFWRRLETREEGKYPRVGVFHLSMSCLHCAEPSCIPACPTSAIAKRKEDGIVVVDRAKCLPNCFACLHACPYKAPQFRPEADARMEKCDFCLDRITERKQPICVASCPLRALDSGPLPEMERRHHGAVKAIADFLDPAKTRPSVRFRPRKSPVLAGR